MKPSDKLVKLTSSDKTGFVSKCQVNNEDNYIEFIIEHNGHEILRQVSEKGIEVTDQIEALFVAKVIDRLVNLGLQKQLEMSLK
jgi:hypothetical protein